MLEVALEEALLPFQMDGNIPRYVLIVSEKLHFSENQQPNYAAPGPVWWSKTCPRAAPLKLGREIQGHFCHGQSNFRSKTACFPTINWLVVSNMFFFHNIWDNPSYCLIFFRGVETTNQIKHGWKIPVRWYINPQEHLQKLLDDAGFSGSYDFLYLPMKFISKLPFGHSKKTTAQTGPWQKNDQQIRYQQGYHSPVCRLTFWTILGFRYATEHPVICQPYTISVSVKGE